MSIEQIRCRFGSVAFDVKAERNLAALFAGEFLDDDQSRSADAVLDFTPLHIASPNYRNQTAAFRWWSGEPPSVAISLQPTKKMRLARRLPTTMQRLLTRKYLTADEQQFSHVLYGTTLWNLFLAAIRRSTIFLHASGVKLGSRCILFCGVGGVGKTTMTAHFIADGAHFLSDDFVTVNAQGMAFPNRLRVHVYPRNIHDPAPPTDQGKRRSLLDRLHWDARARWLSVDEVCRRVDPVGVYNCAIATPAQVTDFVLLYRDPGSPLSVAPISVDEFADANLRVLNAELSSTFGAFACAADALVRNWNIPANLTEHLLGVLCSIGVRARLHKVNMARFMGPTLAYNALRLALAIEADTLSRPS